MTAFLRSNRGRWAVRLVGLAIGWVLATQVLGMAWDGDGHAFLLGILLIVVVAIAYGIDQLLELALSFVPAGPAAPLRYFGPIPPLAKAKQAKARQMHAALVQAGAFASQVPPAEAAFPALAVDRQPVDWPALFDAYATADYYLADADPAQWMDHILFSRMPDGWQSPPPGRRWAFLWEDETIIMVLLAEGAVDTLNAIAPRSVAWTWLDAKAAAELVRSGCLISTNE